MREYFTVMIKENDTGNLKLLSEKLNEGFFIDDRISVGRSTVLTLQRRPADRLVDLNTEGISYAGRVPPSNGGF